MIWVLLLAALGIWAAGAAVDLVVGPSGGVGRSAPYLAGLAGGALVCAAGVIGVLGPPVTADLGSTLAMSRTVASVDGIAGLFLTLTGALAAVVSGCLVSFSRVGQRLAGRGIGAGYLLLLGSVVVVLVAGDAFTFLFAWESLSVSFYVLVGVRQPRRSRTPAAWVTLGFGKVSGAALLVGFLLVAGHTGSYDFGAWAHLPAGAVHDAAYALVVVGFAAKAGVVPLQVWLPVGYPAAPGPTRAAMAGIAANVGFYGLWRFLAVLGRPPVGLAVVVLLVGGVTALVGIAFAGVQSDLNRVVSYSSIENAGLITVGYGIALAGAATAQPAMVAVGLLAATLQVLTHAVAKTALFSSSAFFVDDWGGAGLDDLRGVGYGHRWMGLVFSVASLTLAGLPPTIGFVSEWFLLEALMQEFRLKPLELRLAVGVAGALVALTAGVAALTFARLVGLSILGRTVGPSARRSRIHDGGLLGRVALAVLAASCVGLSSGAPWLIRYLASGLDPVVPRRVTLSALKSPWVLQPVYKDFSILSPSWLSVVMPVGFLAVTVLAVAVSRGRFLRIRRVPAWRSATAGVAGADRYTSFGYANVLRHVLGNVLGSQRQVVTVQEETETGIAEASIVEARTVVVEPVETYVYRPARRALLAVAGTAKRLQSGRLDAYVAYMLVALIAVLIVAAAV